MGAIEDYDVIIIGAGQAGVPLAHSLAKAGRRTALIERQHVGGSCVNFGCTPTKAALASARVAHLARRAGELGVRIPTVEVDFPAVIRRARSIVDSHRSSLERGFAGKENPKLIEGHGRLDGREGDRFRVVAGDATLRGRHVVLDTGTRSVIPPIEGLAGIGVIHAGNWLEHTELPERVVVIGGGVIALEMAQFYRRMGSQVAMIEKGPRIAASEDADVAEVLEELFEREGIEIHLEATIERVEKSGTGVTVHVAGKGAVSGSHLFIATGRKPNTDDLGLDTAGVKVSRGIVETDERLATNVPGIWAAGDIRGGPMFTHTAWDDYRVLHSQLAGDGSRTTERVVPYAIFTDPEVGRVGMNETQARQSGKALQVARFEIRRNSKAEEIGEEHGFIKVIADAGTGQLLGATVLSHEAAELVHVYIGLMNAKAPFHVIRDAVFIHPTLAEAIQSATAALGTS